MHIVETIDGPIQLETDVFRFEIYRNPEGGGSVNFHTLQRMLKGGRHIGVAETKKYSADFAALPATFPVNINGNIVQVSGATILAALDAVAVAIHNQQAAD